MADIKQLSLLPSDEAIAVHCFFRCGHIIRSVNPQEAHRLMEQHYTKKHSRQIDRIIGRTKWTER